MREMRKALAVAALLGMLGPGVALAQTAHPESAPASQAPNPLKEYGDLVVGRWIVEAVFAVDYPGLGKKGEKVTGSDVWRWSADGAVLECEWLLGANAGRVVMWWDASAGQIKSLEVDSGGNWAQGTFIKQGTTWTSTRSGAFADGRLVEYRSEISFEDGGRTRIDAGATILAGVPNEYRDLYRKVVR